MMKCLQRFSENAHRWSMFVRYVYNGRFSMFRVDGGYFSVLTSYRTFSFDKLDRSYVFLLKKYVVWKIVNGKALRKLIFHVWSETLFLSIYFATFPHKSWWDLLLIHYCLPTASPYLIYNLWNKH